MTDNSCLHCLSPQLKWKWNLKENKAQENVANICLVTLQSFNKGGMGNETVGHLPHNSTWIAFYFLAHSGKISVQVIGRRQHCKQLCEGMDIPCQLEINCSKELQMKRLKELWTRFGLRTWRSKQMAPLGATTSTERNDQKQFNLCSLKIFSSIYDPYKLFYSVCKQWSHV